MIHQALDGRPIGLIATSWSGTQIEVWTPPKALQDCGMTTYVQNNIQFFFHYFITLLYSRRDLSMQPYDEPSVMGPRNHTDLYNAMVYPFTRTVIYGAIRYQGKE
jgi:sialate O-acetylesterase